MRNKNARIPDFNKIVTDPGDRYHVLYKPIMKKDGIVELKESGKEDLWEIHNSQRESTDMAFILAQLKMGNTSYLRTDDPMFGDFTEMPKSLAEAQQRIIDAQYAFDRLDPDIKMKFDNNVNLFISSMGSDVWFEKMLPPEGLNNVQEEGDNVDA